MCTDECTCWVSSRFPFKRCAGAQKVSELCERVERDARGHIDIAWSESKLTSVAFLQSSLRQPALGMSSTIPPNWRHTDTGPLAKALLIVNQKHQTRDNAVSVNQLAFVHGRWQKGPFCDVVFGSVGCTSSRSYESSWTCSNSWTPRSLFREILPCSETK